MLQFCHINGGIRTSKNVNFVHKFMSTMKLLKCNIVFFYALKQYGRNNDLVERTNNICLQYVISCVVVLLINYSHCRLK